MLPLTVQTFNLDVHQFLFLVFLSIYMYKRQCKIKHERILCFLSCLKWQKGKWKKKRRILVFVLPGMTDRESENKNTKIFFFVCLEWQTGEWKLIRESCFCLAGNDKTGKIRQHLFYVYVLFSSHIEININLSVPLFNLSVPLLVFNLQCLYN